MKGATTNDDSFHVVTKRRNQKQQSKLDGKVTKATDTSQAKNVHKKRQSDTTNEVATLTAEEGTDQHLASGEEEEEEDDNSNSDPSFIGGFSKKKQQYLTQKIEDRSGTYNYQTDPSQYKKARKRL